MANPNLMNLVSLYGKTSYLALTTTAQTLINNSASSNQLFKVNIISVTNIVTYPVLVTLETVRNTQVVEVTSKIVINPQTTVKLINKNNFMYLEEGDTVQMYANITNSLQALVGYEIIS